MSTLKNKDINNIGSVYGFILNNVKRNIVKESAQVKEGEIGEAPLTSGGPLEKGGFKPASIDKKELSDKEQEDNLYNIDELSYDENLEEDEEISPEIQKIAQESLNNFMSRKSLFDRLYENVLDAGAEPADDLEALDIDTGSEEGSDTVTLTLDREVAEKLHSVLMSILSNEEGNDTEEVETDEDEDMEYGDEDEEDLGHAGVNAKEPNLGKNNKVGNLKPQSGGAQSKYTDKVGDDGDLGHALVNAKEPNMGKNNKVSTLKPGKSMFEQ